MVCATVWEKEVLMKRGSVRQQSPKTAVHNTYFALQETQTNTEEWESSTYDPLVYWLNAERMEMGMTALVLLSTSVWSLVYDLGTEDPSTWMFRCMIENTVF